MNVNLLSYTHNADRLVALASKVCYSGDSIQEIMDSITEEDKDRLINTILNNGHESPLEHIKFTFGIEGISRVVTHQLVRHRIASYSQQSQRYVYERDDFEYIVPMRIYEADKKTSVPILDMYKEMMESYYRDYLWCVRALKDVGYTEKEAIEVARYLLPNATETKIVVTMNARALYNFFSERICRRAQPETRRLAIRMFKMCRDNAPLSFLKAGADCMVEGCQENTMSCGNPINEGEL